MGARTKARKRALDVLYGADVRGESINQALRDEGDRHAADPKRANSWEYARQLVVGITEHGDEIAELIELHTLRKLDGHPVSLIRHRFCASRTELLARYKRGSLRQYLAERDLPLTRTLSLVGARLPSREEADLLMMPRHLPVLTVLTVSRDNSGNPVELSRSTSRSDRFQYQFIV